MTPLVPVPSRTETSQQGSHTWGIDPDFSEPYLIASLHGGAQPCGKGWGFPRTVVCESARTCFAPKRWRPMQRDLVVQARAGDLDAFAQLARASAPRLKGVANLILRDADRAEDVVQDALLLAWRDLRALRDPDAWDAWLRRLTVNACYKTANKDRWRSRVELHVTPDAGVASTPDASVDVAEREWVLAELGRLDIDRRAILVLHYYLDLSLPEVAEILDIPYGSVASRLHRALDAMRTSMGVSAGAETDLATERTP